MNLTAGELHVRALPHVVRRAMSVLPTAVIHSLEVMEPIRRVPLRQAVDALRLMPGAAILDLQDYTAFFNYTMFSGRVCG